MSKDPIFAYDGEGMRLISRYIIYNIKKLAMFIFDQFKKIFIKKSLYNSFTFSSNAEDICIGKIIFSKSQKIINQFIQF